MRFHTAWRAALPALLLSAACSERSAPTALAPQTASFDIVGSTTTATECVTQIDALIARTQDPALTPISGKNAESKDRPGLVAKLNDARSLLAVGKSLDAVKKINDYIEKVEQLGAGGKITPDVAAALTTDAQAAIDCINTIGS